MISADRKILEESPIGTWLLLKLSTYQPAESLIPNPSFQSDQFIFQTFVKQPTTWHRDDDRGKLEEMQDKGIMMIDAFQNFEGNYEAQIWIPDVHIQNVRHPAWRATIITHEILKSWDQIIKIFDN